jgi:hypothetical protein
MTSSFDQVFNPHSIAAVASNTAGIFGYDFVWWLATVLERVGLDFYWSPYADVAAATTLTIRP